MLRRRTVASLIKGLPLAYNKDLQEMQQPLFDAVEATSRCWCCWRRFTAALRFRTERMRGGVPQADI